MHDLPDQDDLSPEATLTRHRALVSALEGERPMDWDAWTLPIYDAFLAGTLTDEGRRAALWAADTLRKALGNDYLAKVIAAERKRHQRQPVDWWDADGPHLIFGQTLWPGANSAPWVFASLLHVAAQFGLTMKKNRPVRHSLQTNLEIVNWVHGLLQLEMAGLGRRAGWTASFETALGTGRRSDVRLQGPSGALLIEASTLRMSQREIEALHTARALSGRVMYGIHDLAAAQGLHVSGNVDTIHEQDQADQWVRAAANAAEEILADGEDRDVFGPTNGTVHLSRTFVEGVTFSVAGPDVPTDPFLRLQVKINDKAQQWAQAPQPGWIRLEEGAGVWSLLHFADLSIDGKLEVVSTRVQQILEPFPQLAGVIIAPSPMWAGSISPVALRVIYPTVDGTAAIVRSALPYHRARETVIVARKDVQDPALELLIDWYSTEGGWLDWALAELGRAPLRELVREQV